MDFDTEKNFWAVAREVIRLESVAFDTHPVTAAFEGHGMENTEKAVDQLGRYVAASVVHADIARGYARMASIAIWDARHRAGVVLRDCIRDNWNSHGLDLDFMEDISISLVAEQWGVAARMIRKHGGTLEERTLPPEGRRAIPDIIIQLADQVLAWEDQVAEVPSWMNLR